MHTTIASGLAEGEDGYEVGQSAADRAVTELAADRVDAAQVFCADTYEYDTVLAAVRETVGAGAELFGCSAAGQFTGTENAAEGILVTVLASDTMKVFTSCSTGLSESMVATVREAVDPLPNSVANHPYLSAMVLHDGLAGVGEQLTLNVQQRLGPYVQFAGGAASESFSLTNTHVFHGEKVLEDGLVVALLAAKEQPAIGVAHGHEPISDPVEVTHSTGNRVHELNGQPAYEVWKDVVREPVRSQFDIEIDEIDTQSPEFAQIMAAFEFGLDQGREYKIRWPRYDSPDTGHLTFAVDIPEGTVMRVMQSSPEQQIESAREAARQAKEAAGETPIAGAIVYDCACRRVILQEEFSTAVRAIDDELDCPVVGWETYGELCMQLDQVSGFHNTTTVVMLLPE